MPNTTRRPARGARAWRAVGLLLAVLTLATAGRGVRGDASPLAAEIESWTKRLATENPDEIWGSVKAGGAPVLERAREALRDGRPFLALLRLAAVRGDLAAGAWLLERPEAVRKDQAAFEAEWKRQGEALKDVLAPPSPEALAAVKPALSRALGEAALHQVRVYYEASLDYSRNTSPDSGFFYLGEALAQRDLVGLTASLLPPRTAGPPPALRSLVPELDALEGDLLSAYKPPASIDRHRDFIVASATLKTARELDAAGLRYGALLRYLQAAQRAAALATPAPSPLPMEALAKKQEESRARLAGASDQSLGTVFLEMAQAELATAAAPAAPPAPPAPAPAAGAPAPPPADPRVTAHAAASTLLTDVLPRYWAALQPPPPRAPKPEASVTVTLVRWPYT